MYKHIISKGGGVVGGMEGGYAESRWTLNKWVLSLVGDSAILTSAGSSFHHCSAKIEKSCDFVVRPLRDGGAKNQAEVVEFSGRAEVCSLTSTWR